VNRTPVLGRLFVPNYRQWWRLPVTAARPGPGGRPR